MASPAGPPQLLVVMPVFNEQAAITEVTRSWFAMLDQHVGEFVLLAINDGSTDASESILRTLQSQLGQRFEWISRPNRGHGQTCMQGYRTALERGIPFIFQIDSDGQSDPAYFADFWNRRNDFDVIYGKRRRQDGICRVLASLILRWSLRVRARVDCVDANVPYRLMNACACADAIRAIPAGIALANIALAVCLKRNPAIRHGSIAIGFPPRHGGEASVPLGKFAAKAFELFRQLRALERN